MDRDAQRELVDRFFSGTGASYRRTATLGTLGFDLWWKRRILQGVPQDASLILDQAAGTGILTFQLARHRPRALVVGVELRREYANVARLERVRERMESVAFVQGRAEEVFLRRPVDCITSSYLAKYADMDALIANAAEMLRIGGVILLHDFTYPASAPLARAWDIYMGVLVRVWRRVYPAWSAALAGLPQLVRKTTWVADAVSALRRHGFDRVEVRRLTWGAAALVSARRGVAPPRGSAG